MTDEMTREIERAAQIAGKTTQGYVLAAVRAQLALDAANATVDEIANAVQAAVELAAALPVGEQFTLKQLARNTTWWNEMRASSHNRVGEDFKPVVIAAGIAEFLGKDGANAAVYVRIEDDGRPRYNRPRRNLGPRY